MLAMKEDAVCLKHRAVRFAAASRQIASKLAPTGFARAVGASLLAMKEDAVCLKHRAVRFAAALRQIADEPAPTGFGRRSAVILGLVDFQRIQPGVFQCVSELLTFQPFFQQRLNRYGSCRLRRAP